MMRNIKKRFIAIALAVVFTVAAPVTGPLTGNVAVAQAATVKISSSKVSMELGATTTLKITGSKSKVTWKTSNKTVATVTSKGLVTAQSAGTAKITATVGNKNYSCTVTVIPALNPYQTTANFQEIQMAGLSFVAPSIYEVTGGEGTKGSYKALLKLPDSLSNITVIANKTGTKAASYEDVVASFDGLSEELVQETFDGMYGDGTTEISDLSTFAYESQNGTTSFAYSFILTTEKAAARMISYNLSIDDYSIQVISRDVEGYDIYIDAEYLIDSLMYLSE